MVLLERIREIERICLEVIKKEIGIGIEIVIEKVIKKKKFLDKKGMIVVEEYFSEEEEKEKIGEDKEWKELKEMKEKKEILVEI